MVVLWPIAGRTTEKCPLICYTVAGKIRAGSVAGTEYALDAMPEERIGNL